MIGTSWMKWGAIALIVVTVIGAGTAIVSFVGNKARLETQIEYLEEQIELRDEVIRQIREELQRRRSIDDTIRRVPPDADDALKLLEQSLGINPPAD